MRTGRWFICLACRQTAFRERTAKCCGQNMERVPEEFYHIFESKASKEEQEKYLYRGIHPELIAIVKERTS